MSYVVSGKVKLTQPQLAEDTTMLQIAGSDTVFSVLVHLMYHLANGQKIQQELRDEIETAKAGHEASSLNWSHIAKLPLLEAIKNEALRLHPPAPSGLPREVPNSGIHIDEIYIPGDTVVSVPTWTIQRGTSSPILQNTTTSAIPTS
jgi:cytochrome P450 family 628